MKQIVVEKKTAEKLSLEKINGNLCTLITQPGKLSKQEQDRTIAAALYLLLQVHLG